MRAKLFIRTKQFVHIAHHKVHDMYARIEKYKKKKKEREKKQ